MKPLNEEEINNLNDPIPIIKIKSVVKNLPRGKTPYLGGFNDEFYQIFKE